LCAVFYDKRNIYSKNLATCNFFYR